MLDDGRLAIRISLTSGDNFEDQNRLCVVIEPLIDPLLRRSAGQLVAVGVNRYRTTAPPEWFNAQDYPTAKPRNTTVSDRAAAAMIGPGAVSTRRPVASGPLRIDAPDQTGRPIRRTYQRLRPLARRSPTRTESAISAARQTMARIVTRSIHATQRLSRSQGELLSAHLPRCDSAFKSVR